MTNEQLIQKAKQDAEKNYFDVVLACTSQVYYDTWMFARLSN